MRIKEFLEQFTMLLEKKQPIKVCGRIQNIREMGSKLKFIDLVSDGHKVQIMSSDNNAKFGRGDILEVEGEACLPRNDKTIKSSMIKLLTECKVKSSLPSPKTGLVDTFKRYEKRHLDLVYNSISLLQQRSQIIKNLRNVLDENGFIEVETPILSKEAGGALAEPFTTQNIDKEKLYLRIAPELYLKRCIIGGMERIFELGKVFRNEGVDRTHQPEFTTLEFYWSFISLDEILCFLEKKLLVNLNLQNLKRVDIVEELAMKMDITYLNLEDKEFFVREVQKIDNSNKENTLHKLFDKLVDYYIKPDNIILLNHPKFCSPLAASHPIKKLQTERFEIFINGIELANGYVELGDPEEQLDRFKQQSNNSADIESNGGLEYVKALEVGLPPTIGCGIGIDRLVMLLTGQKHIRDVILFPKQ